MAWLRDLGVPLLDIPFLDDRIITRIIDPPRDERGKLKVRPKGEPPASGRAGFREKWLRQGMMPHQIDRLWREGLRA